MCTKVNEFYSKLRNMDDKEYVENFLIYNSATVLAGHKTASTVTLKKTGDDNYSKWIRYGRSFIEEIGLDYIELRETKESIIILIYNDDVLKDYIFEEEHHKFLINLGYSKEKNLELALEKLKERYDLYKCPHELGLFLGIPFNDVRDFMECTEKQCLLCGYWKVYNDCNTAIKIFNKYDLIKEHTVNYILKELNSRDLASSIKQVFYSPKKVLS
ncbi:DUF3793 family protein [Clostridium paraputrificum]|uniref:DUF3793 family protein n=1 Tax=Clostridium TaxID=1485 RepID=UPI003D32EEE9